MRGDTRQVGWLGVIAVAGTLALLAGVAQAQETASAAGDSAGNKSEPAGLGQRGEREVGPGDELSFRQQEVAEQMHELEQRMFRLSETLKMLEPENSSRLMLGLKFAREELILHRMRELQASLTTLALRGAVDEQKQVLAKLERLEQLLLSTDLDFDMKLERLRQIRATLRKLDAVVREEAREEKISKVAAEQEKELANLAKRRATLESLVAQQRKHVETNTPLAALESLADDDRQAVGKLGEEQEATRQETKSLASELVDGATPKNLATAMDNMQSAVDALAKTAPAEALPPMQTALEALEKELADVTQREADVKAALSPEQLALMRSDQEGNHRATDEVTEMTRRLGSNGTATLAELMRAGGFMEGAESAFGNGQAGSGNGEQKRALEALKYAEELLAEEAERLARQLRREVKKRVSDGLTLMLEEQIVVRERTTTLQKGVAESSRQALSALSALAKREEKITSVAQDLINVVEETEFGIALPAALAAVRDATEGVQLSLAAGDASDDVIHAEKQIEADLQAMLEVVSEMSDANSRTGQRGGQSQEERRREQNRIISELKMLRLLENRVLQSTKEVDAKRESATLSPAVRKRIEYLEGRQDDIRDATELLAEERSEEIPLPE